MKSLTMCHMTREQIVIMKQIPLHDEQLGNVQVVSQTAQSHKSVLIRKLKI
jgi:hypothetical protein